MRERFSDWNPRGESSLRVQQCNEIIDAYRAQGLILTLRQLYYQFVARDIIPNNERSYKNLGNLVSKARVAGLMDWSAIEDRGRRPDRPSQFENLAELVDAALDSYRLPRWFGQEAYAELWVEKAALAGVLEPMARKFHVTLMVNKGYSSQSAMYESAKRLENVEVEGTIHIFYLGDHDPSGEDMVRDIRDRLELFTNSSLDLNVEKLALTSEQVREYNPPPNPTKITDSRARAYIEKHGDESWEVDALDPTTLQQIISDAFTSVIDMSLMDQIKVIEEKDKDLLREAVGHLTENRS